MTKKILSSLIFPLISVIPVFSQNFNRQDADSMLKTLKKSKSIEHIELLLNLAQFHIFKPGENQIDFDSASVYINQAKELCRSEKSVTADGYLLLTESYMVKEKGKRDESKKMLEQAIRILESGQNKTYLGTACYELSFYFDYRDSLQLSQKIFFVKKALDAFEKAGDLKGKGKSLQMLGDLYSNNGNSEAIPLLKQALATYDSIKSPYVQGVYVLLGIAYYSQKKDYGQALYYMLSALRTARVLNDTSSQLCQINYSIGIFYKDIDRKDLAIKYLNDALEIAQKYNDAHSNFLIAINTSGIYCDLEQPDQSLKALAWIPGNYLISDDLFIKSLINICFFRTYTKLKQFNNAKPYRDTLLRLADNKLVPEQRQSNIYRYMTAYYLLNKEYLKAQFYLTKSIDITEKINFEIGRIQNLQLLYQLDSSQGKFRSAFDYLLSYKKKNDSVSSEKTLRQFQVLAVEYEVGMKEDSIKLRDKDIALLRQTNSLQLANLRQVKLTKNVTIAGIILAFVIIGLLFNRYRVKQKTNKKLETQQAEIAKQNHSLQHLLNEKEWLLKEIHHRVKNNLQIVMSLLNSQSAYINNDAALTAIHDSQHRVHAMSLIHQKLYGSENVSSIDMSFYVRELVSYLRDSFDTGQRIRFELNVEPLELDVSQAVPLGLILNEAITNSIKYAFQNDRDGVITISISNTSPNHYLLSISDNGVGMPAQSRGKKAGSLGMSLMTGLAEDLEGKFAIENDNGTTIKISFVRDTSVKRPDPLASSFVTSN